MIDWTKYFDKIICINLKGYKTRKNLMKTELKRVGILKHPNFLWEVTYNNSLEQQYKEFLSINDKIVKDISLIIGYINAIKKAYYLGCETLLLLNDTNRFLKDLDKIKLILLNIPTNQDVIIFNKQILNYIYFFNTIKNRNRKNTSNQYFYDYINLKVGDGIGLNRKAMKQIISLFEVNDFTTVNLKIENNFYVAIWNRVFSLTNLIVDAIFFDQDSSLTNEEKKVITELQQQGYRNQDVNFDNYMMRKDGSPYIYGDWIEE